MHDTPLYTAAIVLHRVGQAKVVAVAVTGRESRGDGALQQVGKRIKLPPVIEPRSLTQGRRNQRVLGGMQ